MNLLRVFAEAVTDSWLKSTEINLTFANAETWAREALKNAKPSGWLVEFPKGTVFIEDEVLMRINLANGYRVTPLFAGEEL